MTKKTTHDELRDRANAFLKRAKTAEDEVVRLRQESRSRGQEVERLRAGIRLILREPVFSIPLRNFQEQLARVLHGSEESEG